MDKAAMDIQVQISSCSGAFSSVRYQEVEFLSHIRKCMFNLVRKGANCFTKWLLHLILLSAKLEHLKSSLFSSALDLVILLYFGNSGGCSVASNHSLNLHFYDDE